MYNPVKETISKADFSQILNSKNIGVQQLGKIKMNDSEGGDEYFRLSDLPAIANSLTSPIISISNMSTAVQSEFNYLLSDLTTAGQNYLQFKYGTDSLDTSLNPYDKTNLSTVMSNVLIAHTDYSHMISMTDNERIAYSVALFSINDYVLNQTLFNAQTTEDQSIRKIVNDMGNKVSTNGFFSWLKKSIISPIVTFVVEVVTLAAAVTAAVVVGSFLAVDLGAAIGALAGAYVWKLFIQEPIIRVLKFWGLYSDPTGGDGGAQDHQVILIPNN